MTKNEAPAVAIREALDKVLKGFCIDSEENQGLHGWRCKHKDRWPEPCGHYEELLDELVAEVMRAR